MVGARFREFLGAEIVYAGVSLDQFISSFYTYKVSSEKEGNWTWLAGGNFIHELKPFDLLLPGATGTEGPRSPT